MPAGQLDHEALIASAEPVPDAGRRGDDLAGIFHTGGTTSRSKGVMLSHANILANVQNALPGAELLPETRYVHAAPMFHLADGAMTFLVTACGGAHDFLSRFDPAAMMAMVEEHRITHALIVPTMINMLVHHPDVARREPDAGGVDPAGARRDAARAVHAGLRPVGGVTGDDLAAA